MRASLSVDRPMLRGAQTPLMRPLRHGTRPARTHASPWLALPHEAEPLRGPPLMAPPGIRICPWASPLAISRRGARRNKTAAAAWPAPGPWARARIRRGRVHPSRRDQPVRADPPAAWQRAGATGATTSPVSAGCTPLGTPPSCLAPVGPAPVRTQPRRWGLQRSPRLSCTRHVPSRPSPPQPNPRPRSGRRAESAASVLRPF